MKIPLKIKLTYRDSLLSLAVVFGLSVFCTTVGLPLIIPFLLLFLGLHLFFFNKSSIKLFLSLGLLLTIIVFAITIMQVYLKTAPNF